MNTTGRAKGPGPHRVPRITQARGKPKSEEWCGKPAGLHGPLLLGCGQGLALQGSSANEGRFRQFMPELSKTQDPSALIACQPRPGSASRRMRALPSPAPPPRPAGTSECGALTLVPATNASAGLGTGPAPVSAPEVRAAAHRCGLSAPRFGEALRDEVVTGINAAREASPARESLPKRMTLGGHGTWVCRAVRGHRC